MKTFIVHHKSKCQLCGNMETKNTYVVQSENDISGIRNMQTDIKELRNLIDLHNIDVVYPDSRFIVTKTEIY